jgi:hypothetical protein
LRKTSADPPLSMIPNLPIAPKIGNTGAPARSKIRVVKVHALRAFILIPTERNAGAFRGMPSTGAVDKDCPAAQRVWRDFMKLARNNLAQAFHSNATATSNFIADGAFGVLQVCSSEPTLCTLGW